MTQSSVFPELSADFAYNNLEVKNLYYAYLGREFQGYRADEFELEVNDEVGLIALRGFLLPGFTEKLVEEAESRGLTHGEDTKILG